MRHRRATIQANGIGLTEQPQHQENADENHVTARKKGRNKGQLHARLITKNGLNPVPRIFAHHQQRGHFLQLAFERLHTRKRQYGGQRHHHISAAVRRDLHQNTVNHCAAKGHHEKHFGHDVRTIMEIRVISGQRNQQRPNRSHAEENQHPRKQIEAQAAHPRDGPQLHAKRRHSGTHHGHGESIIDDLGAMDAIGDITKIDHQHQADGFRSDLNGGVDRTNFTPGKANDLAEEKRLHADRQRHDNA
uniref:Uncharacterized protein n=1 Tax=Vibrio sp. MV-1 TaxID=632142 RepID=A0A221SKZ4_9VIBR|nr:hypothetical protein [Vibrio sp. MV-1]